MQMWKNAQFDYRPSSGDLASMRNHVKPLKLNKAVNLKAIQDIAMPDPNDPYRMSPADVTKKLMP